MNIQSYHFLVILKSLNEILASFDIFALRCYNKRQGRKFRPVWRQNTLPKRVKFAHKNSIYSKFFSLNLQFMACSFSHCSPVKYTFSFQRASLAKSWNMTVKIAENDARTSQFSLLSSPRGRNWVRGQLSPHEWRARDMSAVWWEKSVGLQQRKKGYGGVSYLCTSVVSLLCTAMSEDRLPSRLDLPYKLLYFSNSSPYKPLYYAWVTCGAAEHLIDGSGKRFRRLSFEF